MKASHLTISGCGLSSYSYSSFKKGSSSSSRHAFLCRGYFSCACLTWPPRPFLIRLFPSSASRFEPSCTSAGDDLSEYAETRRPQPLWTLLPVAATARVLAASFRRCQSHVSVSLLHPSDGCLYHDADRRFRGNDRVVLHAPSETGELLQQCPQRARVDV